MQKRFQKHIAGLIVTLVGLSCSERFSDNPLPNQPPETFISIFSERTLNETISQKVFHWWGDDPDGMVVGFIYTFDPNAANVTDWDTAAPHPDWTFTPDTRKTFNLKLSGTDTVYTLHVKAVDDGGAADPSPAVQTFPIVNTRPVVEFPVGTEVPETTFTVATFAWVGRDLDGNETIEHYEYVLDDTTEPAAWVTLDPQTTSVTLTAEDGLIEGEHAFYLRALDIAGAQSETIRMPPDEEDVWYVREPKSTTLLLDDYNIADGTDGFYRATFEAMVGPVDVWDIKSNDRALEPASSKAFTETLLLFDRVFWYADSDPNLEKAQIAVPAFLNAGGKMIMSMLFQEFSSNEGDQLDFSPVDSIGSRISRITRDQAVVPTEAFAASGFPKLRVNTAIIPNVFPLAPKVTAQAMYRLPEKPGAWEGMPPMAVVDGQQSFVFFGLPLAKLNGLGTVPEVFEKILQEVF